MRSAGLIATGMTLTMLLLGCEPIPAQQVPPPPTDTATSAPPAITATSTRVPSQTSTPTATATTNPSSTNSPTKTSTSTLTPTGTRTNTPLPTGTRTPTPTATDTRLVACTPPPCNSNEVFYCPGVCPNGCGTQCATKTPTPTLTASPFPTPPAPGNFAAVGTGNTIQFSLDDNSNVEQGYYIYEVGIDNPVMSYLTLGSHGTGHYTYTWNGIPCNLSATFFVRAYSPGGISAASNSSPAMTVPCAPINFTVTGATQMGSLYFSFTDSASNESGFRVYRSNPDTPVWTLPAWLGTGISSSTAMGPFPCGT